VQGTGVQILDTRKTMPGLRALEKAAVRAGGGRNHRTGLYDAILIKENHVAAAGGIAAAIERARSAYPEPAARGRVPQRGRGRPGARNRGPAHPPGQHVTRRTSGDLRPRGDRAELEASGGITLDTVRAHAVEA